MAWRGVVASQTQTTILLLSYDIGHCSRAPLYEGESWMNENILKPAHTVTELASARTCQHQENWPTIMERAVEGMRRRRAGIPGFSWLSVKNNSSTRH